MCSFEAANLGAILARSIGKLENLGRIGSHVRYDPAGAPIEISADIGRRDKATWWFWQPKMGGYSLVDYDGGWGIDAEDWCDRLRMRLLGKKLGKIWLPHDARAKTFAAKHSAVEIFVKVFGADKVEITPDSKKSDRVNAARTLISKCEFSDECETGLDGLRAWSYEYNEETKTFSSEPQHDWASHDGDGFSYGCLVMQQTKPPPVVEPPVFPVLSDGGRMTTGVSLDELWKTAPRPSRRI
jgi:phage terminase large subunit